MRAFSCDRFVLPLPEKHRFPMAKYRLLADRLVADGVVGPGEVVTPPLATDDQLLRVHDADWVERVSAGRLRRPEIRAMGFPWSPELPIRSRCSVGATIAAARWAVETGTPGINLAGGTHHAFADRGEGFCVFNDAAVAARALQSEGLARRVSIIDCDVHQGNGTARIFRDDPSVFTLSVHGAKNYPLRKETSDLDVALPDGTGDDLYLEALQPALERALDAFGPDLAIYLAGADPFVEDRLGRLALTAAGLARRDRAVLGRSADLGIPVAVAMAGGYAPDLEALVALHLRTIRIADEASRSVPRGLSRPRDTSAG